MGNPTAEQKTPIKWNTARKELDQMARDLLRSKLEQIPPRQKERFLGMFAKVYQGKDPIQAMPNEQVVTSIDLINRTIQTNERDGVTE